MSFGISAANTTWLDTPGGRSSHITGNNATEAGVPGEPMPLLRLHKGLRIPPNAISVDPNPTDGILIWLERMEGN